MYKQKAELLQQIDEMDGYANEVSGTLASLLRDCRAEIERPNIDALIAEIDGLLVLEEIGFRTTAQISDIKDILEKYRCRDNQIDTVTALNTARLTGQQTATGTGQPTGR